MNMLTNLDGHLKCPNCNYTPASLHHDQVTVFERDDYEDGRSNSLTISCNDGGWDDAETDWNTKAGKIDMSLKLGVSKNPSSRRNAVAIQFYCEHCYAINELTFAQHKRVTQVEWRHVGERLEPIIPPVDLEFNDERGRYLIKGVNIEIEIGTMAVVDTKTLTVGWQKRRNGKVVDSYNMGRVADAYQPPTREELGNLNRANWEVDDFNQPIDPWQFVNLVIMREVGEEGSFKFATSSRGGINALGVLCKAYAKKIRTKPDVLPIIELDVDTYYTMKVAVAPSRSLFSISLTGLGGDHRELRI